MPSRLDASDPGFAAAFDEFLNVRREEFDDVDAAVAEIIAAVRDRGDEALIELTREFDRHEVTGATLRIGADEVAAAKAACDPKALEALETAAARITAYHARQMPEDLDYTDEAGVRLGHRWRPVAAVGMYVPGGTAAYPSSVLMNALPLPGGL